jgi:hypothetical protein
MSKKELYVIVQTTKIWNKLRFFLILMSDIRKQGLESEFQAKKFMELVFNQAAAIYEVIEVLEKDLLHKYKAYIAEKQYLELHQIVKDWKSKKVEDLEIIKDIRNKHSSHIAHDENYIHQLITDDPALFDLKIASGESSLENRYFYTLDASFLIGYLMKTYKKEELEMYIKVKDCITDYTKLLYGAFDKIMDTLLRDKVYVNGKNEE